MKTLEQTQIKDKTKEYNITGMTCKSCEAKVKKTLEAFPQIEKAEISVEDAEGKLYFEENIPTNILQEKLSEIGNYTITEKTTISKIDLPKNNFSEIVYEEVEKKPTNSIQNNHSNTEISDLPNKSLNTYKPLFMIVGFILGVSVLVQYPFAEFSFMLLMRHFMAGFFIVFAFFKLLNLEGFANSYQMYDIVAAKWKGWGLIYPFVELALGIAYLINVFPFYVNLITIVVLGISSIGVIKSNLDNKKIKCACLGDVFNLPMSTVTIIEDLSMVAMALIMLFMI
jgi:copper chaperone CopZ